MRYGFVIDQDRCIGCHACTVACKEEHQVPIGVFRTWVKYVEKGEFPHTSRHFGVMRCNHCDSAPCIEICPTRALYRRSDGIVDFDNQRCIGCKSCMQACPYDALYIDPNTNTAAKCNFCAHRVENNLEPACVIVCPTQAIIAGDLDNPASTASQIVATQKVSVRKPEKGTDPKLFYKGIEGDLLEPTRLSRQNTFVFAEQHDGRPVNSSFDPAVAREVYDVAHPAPWGWKIAAYLWTKSIAAGVMLVAALYRHPSHDLLLGGVILPTIALLALAATMALLVFDLKRPDRFHYLLLKPNFRSWLVLGAYILMGFGICTVLWLLLGIADREASDGLMMLTVLFALAAAGYSAFLFAQAKGRDFWQSSLVLFHLLLQALIAGTATMVIVCLVLNMAWGVGMRYTANGYLNSLLWLLPAAGLMIFAELFLPHGTRHAQLAAHSLTRGTFRARFWGLTVGCGLVLPFLLVLLLPDDPSGALGFVAALLALLGLWWWESLWVKAGQIVPLS